MKTVSFHDLKVGRSPAQLLLELNSERQDNSLRPGLNLIVAPNGYGKTTLLQTLAGALASYGGQVRIDGKVLKPEQDVLYVSEYLTFPKFIYPREWVDFIAGDASSELPPEAGDWRRWIDGFALEPKMRSYLGRMSQGERRKVTWLGAHASRKPVLLLDEPLDGLDLPAIRTARDLIQEWKRQERILLMVAHQVGEVLDMADQVFLIREKRLVPWSQAFERSWKEMTPEEFRQSVLGAYSS